SYDLLQFNIIENLSVVFTIFIFLIFIYLTIINKRFNFILLIIFIYFVWRSSVSYFYSEEVLDLTNSLKIITLVLFINLIIDKYPKSTLSALSSLFSIYIYKFNVNLCFSICFVYICNRYFCIN